MIHQTMHDFNEIDQLSKTWKMCQEKVPYMQLREETPSKKSQHQPINEILESFIPYINIFRWRWHNFQTSFEINQHHFYEL